MQIKNPIICAIDTDDEDYASKLIADISPHVGAVKLGLEFFVANGAKGVANVMKGADLPLFLDLKFHDIPNTVAKAVLSTADINCFMMTVHVSGGREMMKRASESANELAQKRGGVRPLIVGVTVLTSLDDNDLGEIGCKNKSADQVLNLAELAQDSGLDGIVCSPHEINLVRSERCNDFKLVVPGIRPEQSLSKDDQKRVMSPLKALKEGADYLVIGRPITKAQSPKLAAKEIVTSLE